MFKQEINIGEKLSEKELCPDDLLKGQEAAFLRDIERLKARYQDFVEVPCPACNAVEHEDAFVKFLFHYVTCKGCRTIFMTPRPSPELMASYYAASENYRYWASHIFPASEEVRCEKIHRPWLNRILDYCDRYGIPKGTLVEVGSGFGTFASLATQSGEFSQVIAVEPTPEMAQACLERGVDVINKRIEDIHDDIEEADIVVSFETLEHLFEPRLFLQQAARLLKPGGLLVLSCPNGQGFDISILGGKALAVDPEHVNFFNPGSLTLLVESCGFQVLEVTTPGRLDAEFVRTAVLEGQYDVSDNPFLKRVLVDEWDRLGWPFQQFLAQHGLSSHMWMAAGKSK
jgi:2-polyprenyl-3-methyl-5-hydroxy-6-metoxy-1,4-benzoquinol methylase